MIPSAAGAALLSVGSLLAPTAVARDRVPPVFAGLRSATTCIPGPVRDGRTGVYHLRWPAARDNRTPQPRILYDIYQATSPGGESYTKPTYQTRPGATSVATPPLPSTTSFYFVVRARDAAGNHDHNRRQQRGTNLCL
jgi:hypothetical protein